LRNRRTGDGIGDSSHLTDAHVHLAAPVRQMSGRLPDGLQRLQ
jgi:hypothetical protein